MSKVSQSFLECSPFVLYWLCFDEAYVICLQPEPTKESSAAEREMKAKFYDFFKRITGDVSLGHDTFPWFKLPTLFLPNVIIPDIDVCKIGGGGWVWEKHLIYIYIFFLMDKVIG